MCRELLMEFLGAILEILKCTGPPLCKFIEYHRKVEEYMKNLKRALYELKSQKDDIQLRLGAECGFGKIPKNQVKNWLENVQMIIDDAERVEQTFKKVKCFSRASLAKLVDKKTQEVKEFLQKGTSFIILVIDEPLSGGITLPTTTLVGETTAKKNMEEIWGFLMGNEIKKIGVCGMGGAGKTTIMTHVNNRLLKDNVKFNTVIWVTVSQTVDLFKLQKEIAIALKENFQETEDVRRRAGMLSEMLRGRRFVLILDDVWERISLEELGIPEPTEENGCKLVITTRSWDVCRSMGSTIVQVKSLSENESLELFFEKAELDISKVPTLKETVELVVKQCAGLPLAIVTIASSLKGELDICEWRNALSELSNNVKSIKVRDDEVFVRLKFSYDRLKEERIQRCFLYCALYPEDHDIPKDELVDCWIAEGLVDEMDNLQVTEERARIIIKSLVSNCLLLESLDNEERSCVKLHDVVRDMTIRYITSKSPLFMVKAGLNLDELPSEQEWKENLDKVSLMDDLIREIPSSMSPNCQILSTLLLQDNPLESIPESFFTHMHGLKILNLSRTEIESLPNSISELTNLTALLLQNCKRLKRVPSLAKLRALAKLELGYTAINEVPAGMEMLANLTILDLLCLELHMIPAGIFSKVCRLQKLRVNWGLETLKVAVEEAATLKKLDRLLAQFHNLQDFNCFMKSLNSHGILSEYCLLLCPNGIDDEDQLDLGYWRSTLRYDVNKAVILDGCNICGREEEDSIVLPKQVEFLRIRRCRDVRNISNIPTFNTLERLETLEVVNCAEMEELIAVDDDDDDNEERKLKRLSLSSMPKLKKIISSSSSKLQLGVLKNLEEIYVGDCNEMEEIIAIDDVDCKKELMISLPKLRNLTLIYMPELKSIINVCGGSNGVLMVCDSLQVIDIWWCPQLKRFPIYLPIDEKGEPSPPPALNIIRVEREWWEALEWDHLHPNAKTLLLPFCHIFEC
ncbi:hypothetical protein LWI28_023023 [Acer negundo]|uniref:NB-ARC domain-containing protein n=1 Tax=Acer negundo TaxID=4023 RepID=A0AAD5P4R0_ACENE|nr:hypothetical protein LWI28_023023 [Acer negundo]